MSNDISTIYTKDIAIRPYDYGDYILQNRKIGKKMKIKFYNIERKD